MHVKETIRALWNMSRARITGSGFYLMQTGGEKNLNERLLDLLRRSHHDIKELFVVLGPLPHWKLWDLYSGFIDLVNDTRDSVCKPTILRCWALNRSLTKATKRCTFSDYGVWKQWVITWNSFMVGKRIYIATFLDKSWKSWTKSCTLKCLYHGCIGTISWSARRRRILATISLGL